MTKCNLEIYVLKCNGCKQPIEAALQVIRQSSTNIGRTITDTMTYM